MDVHPPDPGCQPPSPPDALIAQLSLIDRLISLVCRRRRLRADDAEEFSAHVRMRLVDNGYELWSRCCEAASLRKYLVTVIDRLYLDYRISQWGRWRPSVHAKRRGKAGILLDQLLTRDGFTFDEAFNHLQTNHQLECNRDDLYALSVRLPARNRRRPVTGSLEHMPAVNGNPEAILAEEEATRVAGKHKAALKAALRRLAPEDRRLLELRYRAGLSVIAIARQLGLPKKPLYHRLDNIVRVLRRHVAANVPQLDGCALPTDISISW